MIPHVLRNLSELDIENLQCGRITAQTIHEAARRLTPEGLSGIIVGGYGRFYTDNDRALADELHDMLEAARKMREANGGWVGINASKNEIMVLVERWENDINKRVETKHAPFQAGGTGF